MIAILFIIKVILTILILSTLLFAGDSIANNNMDMDVDLGELFNIVLETGAFLEADLKNSPLSIKGVPQFYNAITYVAKAVPRMISLGLEQCKIFLQNLLDAIVLTKYYPSKIRRSFERISRKPHNKWKASALKKIKNNKRNSS